MAVIMIISCLLPLTSYAAETSPFVITGEYDGNFTLTASEESLFHISSAAPGNIYTGKITVKNNGPDKMDISITDIANNISNPSLYEKLELKISYDGSLLYSGIYGATPDPVTEFIAVNPRSSIDFNIEVIFPEDSNNEFQGKILNTTWVFEAQYHNKERVQTGHEIDTVNPMENMIKVVVFICVALMATSMLLVIFIKRKKINEQE